MMLLMRAVLSVALGALMCLSAVSADALPIDPIEPPDCPPGYHLVNRRCVRDRTPVPPLPPVNQAFGMFDLARQTTTKDGVRLVGWTADRDAPTSPTSVNVIVDGALLTTVTADRNRPDVEANIAGIGSNHGFDFVLPLTGDEHRICATAVNVGPGSDGFLGCKEMDAVLKFAGNNISYDLERAVIGSPSEVGLYRVKHRNATRKDQSFSLAGSKDVETTSEWKRATEISGSVTVELEGKAGIPFLASGSSKLTVQVSGSYSFEEGSSITVTDHWEWQQQIEPASKRITVTTVAVTRSTLDVPYTLTGSFVYDSGALIAGHKNGMYSGASTHDLDITSQEYYLDGTPVPDGVRVLTGHQSRRTTSVS